MANTVIKVVKGNVLRLDIPLQVKIRNTEDGEPTERTEDFYPSLEYPVVVKLTRDYKAVSLTAEVVGNVVKVEDKGTLKVGCYQIEVICQDDEGNPYRFAEPCVIHVVNYTKDADIEAGVEFNAETYTLEGAVFIAYGGGSFEQVQADWGENDTHSKAYIKNKPDLSGFITISVNNLVNYYLKSETYTKTEVQTLIAAIQQFHYEIYASTSDVTSPQGNVLYLIGPTGTGADKYEEYVYANSQFVKIGDTSIDLSGYYTSQQTDSAISQALNVALANYTTTAALTLLLAGKQDVINDLSDIRSGAAAGATAYQKPQGGIPSSDMSQGVQASLGKADTALQTETDPTVPSWAKQSSKPSYTAQEVGALPNSTKYGSTIDLAMDSATYVLTLSLKDQDGTVLNTKTVDLPIESVVVNGRYDAANKKIVLTLQSGSTIDVPVGDLIAGLQTEITSVNMLDADLVDDTNSTHKFVTAQEKANWNKKSDFSGSYNDLSDKPNIPVVPTDVSAFNNDAGYLTQHQSLANYYTKTEIDAMIGNINTILASI